MKRFLSLLFLLSLLSLNAHAVSVRVEAEEDVYTFTNPDNGSGPMWAFGSSTIARDGGDVFVCQYEVGEGVPLLCNTRWRLLRRAADGWKAIAECEKYNQREPCPLAVMGGTLYLSVNDSTQPPGTKYGNCLPHVLRFAPKDDAWDKTALMPVWRAAHKFTDHSYRGFAADPAANRIVMLNIDADTGVENACLMTAAGETVAGASIEFPIRSCYPQVALVGNTVHVMAVGDIVEPVEEWRKYKFEQTGREWDYVFRILYYSAAADIAKGGFAPPLEIANVDKTAGGITNQDMWIAPDGAALLMYKESEVASALMRDKFFPGKSLLNSMHLAVVRDGAVVSRRVLHTGAEGCEAGWARFHTAADGTVYAVLHVTGPEAGNKIMQVWPEIENPPLIPLPAAQPLTSFFLASVRLGSRPSDTIDILGPVGNTMRYIRAVLEK